jgi:sulfate adenylyltransferase subunit 1 (EFTu-like GTPase family)
MATGASTADLAILLIDARQGVRVQSRRHAASPGSSRHPRLRARDQQDDLVEFDRGLYEAIRDEFEEMLTGARVHAIPLSALHATT